MQKFNNENIIFINLIFNFILFTLAALFFYINRRRNLLKIKIHKTSEDQLQLALKKYESLIDTVDGIVWESTPEFSFTFVSKKAKDILGYPIESWLNNATFWPSHLHPADKDFAINFCVEQTAKKLPHDFEYRMIAADGRTVWLRDIVTVVTENNKLIGLRGLMIDITARVTATLELEKTLSLIGATLESTADGILLVDLEGKILRYNQKFKYLWRIPDEILDQGNDNMALQYILDQLKNPELFLAKVKELYATPYAESTDLIYFKSGRILERYSQPQLIEGKSVGRVWSFRDITEQRRAIVDRENLLIKEKEARLAIEQSIKLRDDFLLIASHELRIPLTPIRMCLQMINRHIKSFSINTKKSDLLKRALENADQQFDRFILLIENLIDVSRITAGRLLIEPEKVDLKKLVENTISKFEPKLIKEGYLLNLHTSSSIIGDWDPERLSQVLVNLLNNSVKYGTGNPIDVDVIVKNSIAKIIVQDHGIGISKEDKAKVFGKFERSDSIKHYEGLGLSLYISQNIIAAHGGSISLESEEGKGATFTISLPIQKEILPITNLH